MSTENEIRAYFRAAVIAQSLAHTGRHPDCPCEDGKCIYPECTCALTRPNGETP